MSKTFRNKVDYFVRNQQLNDDNSVSPIEHWVDKEANLKKNGKKVFSYEDLPKEVKKVVRVHKGTLNPIAPINYDRPSRGHPLRKQKALLKKVQRRNDRAKEKQKLLNDLKSE